MIWEADESDQSAYGLYPVGCTGVTIDACEVGRASGNLCWAVTKILVKDSEMGEMLRVLKSKLDDVEVVNNYAHDNTAGILFNLPGLPKPGESAHLFTTIVLKTTTLGTSLLVAL